MFSAGRNRGEPRVSNQEGFMEEESGQWDGKEGRGRVEEGSGRALRL